MDDAQASELMRAAVMDTGTTLVRSPGRQVTSGLLEVNELAPALRNSLSTRVAAVRVRLNYTAQIANWSRPTSQVDLVLLGPGGSVEIAAALKVWDISSSTSRRCARFSRRAYTQRS